MSPFLRYVVIVISFALLVVVPSAHGSDGPGQDVTRILEVGGEPSTSPTSSCSGSGFVAEKQTSGTAKDLRSVFFQNAGVGWAGGKEETLLWTGDSGRAWTVVRSGGNGSFDDVQFPTKDLGFIAATAGWGWDKDPNYVGGTHLIAKGSNKSDLLRDWSALLITEDGGATWKKSFVPTNFVMSSARFVDRNLGYFTSYGSEGHDDSDLWLTRDGGRSFQQWRNSGCWCYWHDSEMVDPNTWFVTGENFLYTTDGGATFGGKATPAWMKLKGISFADKTRAWAVGDGGKIVNSSDGGMTWAELNSSSQVNLRAVHFVSPNEGWAVGNGGTILRTTDAGLAWSSFASGTTVDLEEVHFPEPCFGWVVGAGGTILLLRDGTPPPKGGVARVDVSPASSSITADQTLKLTASGFDANGTPVPIVPAWSATGGAVDPNGLYTPQNPGSLKVTATSGGVSGQATVTVTAGALAKIVVDPAAATVALGSSQLFAAKGSDAKGNNVSLSPAWTASGGTIDGSGLYSSSTPGRFTVTATQGSVSGTADVTVLGGTPVTLEISPVKTTLRADESSKFTATARDAQGNEVAAPVAWKVGGGPGEGFIDASGTYTPETVGDFTVSAELGTLHAEAVVSVSPGRPASAVISPASVELSVGDSSQLAVAVADVKGNAITTAVVTWSVEGGVGEVSTTGLFVAKAPGDGRSVVTVTEGPVAVSSSSSIKVTAAPEDPPPPKGPVTPSAGTTFDVVLFAIVGGGLAAILSAAGLLMMRRRRPPTCQFCGTVHPVGGPCAGGGWQ